MNFQKVRQKYKENNNHYKNLRKNNLFSVRTQYKIFKRSQALTEIKVWRQLVLVKTNNPKAPIFMP